MRNYVVWSLIIVMNFLFISCDVETSVGLKTYKITIKDSETEILNFTVEGEQQIIKPYIPPKEHYEFIDLFQDSALTKIFKFNDGAKSVEIINKDTTIYTKWRGNSYTVTFNVNGGSLVSSQNIIYPNKVTKPSDPTRVLYTFGGWYKEDSLQNVFNFNSEIITANTVLYAKWTASKNTVTFNVNSGSAISDQNVIFPNKVTKPNDPTRDYHNFADWYKESSLENVFSFSSEIITANTSLYAKWTAKERKLLASDRETDDRFGNSLAIDGNTLVIGANAESSDGKTQNGAVYVFTKSGGTWSQSHKLLASDKETEDYLGHSVAIDGDTIVVGAYGEDSDGKTDNGAVYVFTNGNNTWSQSHKLLASDKETQDYLGYSVAIDGGTIVAGAPFADIGSMTFSGVVYVFTNGNNTWSESQKLSASDKDDKNYLGWSVAIDSGTILTSAIGSDDGKTENGAVYVFDKSGNIWSESQKLTASDKESYDRLGTSLAIDNNTIIVGAENKNDGGKIDNGAVYVFTNGNNVWSESQKLTASDKNSYDQFGFSLAIDDDSIVVGAYKGNVSSENLIDNGAAYVFKKSSNVWSESQKLLASDRYLLDKFGSSVVIEGSLIITGAIGNGGHGSVYVYEE